MARQFSTDCEGPISKNDNAQELTSIFVPEGGALFARVSKYDDYLADVVRKPGYKAGDTLRLILPFLRAYGATNEKIEAYSAAHILLVPGAKATMEYIGGRMPAFIISTSYRPYIHALCEVIGFPEEHTYCTELDIDRYALSDEEVVQIEALAEEIRALPMLELPSDATALGDLPRESQEVVKRLDAIFWEEIPRMACGRMLNDVNPVGGIEKANALRDSLKRTGNASEDAMYVGDSITDVQAFDLVREHGGVAISFNGNRYALHAAEIACMADHTALISILAQVFSEQGKAAILELARRWSPSTAEKLGVEATLLDEAFSECRHIPPRVALVSADNRDRLTEESETIRKTVRGEEVGKLG